MWGRPLGERESALLSFTRPMRSRYGQQSQRGSRCQGFEHVDFLRPALPCAQRPISCLSFLATGADPQLCHTLLLSQASRALTLGSLTVAGREGVKVPEKLRKDALTLWSKTRAFAMPVPGSCGI